MSACKGSYFNAVRYSSTALTRADGGTRGEEQTTSECCCPAATKPSIQAMIDRFQSKVLTTPCCGFPAHMVGTRGVTGKNHAQVCPSETKFCVPPPLLTVSKLRKRKATRERIQKKGGLGLHDERTQGKARTSPIQSHVTKIRYYVGNLRCTTHLTLRAIRGSANSAFKRGQSLSETFFDVRRSQTHHYRRPDCTNSQAL